MQKNLFGVKMLFEIQKLQLNPLFFYLNNISPPQRLFCKHEDTCFIFEIYKYFIWKIVQLLIYISPAHEYAHLMISATELLPSSVSAWAGRGWV